MRPNSNGWMIPLSFLVAGIALWVVMPNPLLGQGLVAVSLIGFVVFAFMARRAESADADWSGAGGASQAQPPANSDFTVTSSVQSFTADADTGNAILEALQRHGIDTTTGGTYDLNDMPAAREAVLSALRNHGIDVAHDIAAAAPGIPIQQTETPTERMTKLNQLRDAGLISPEEYDANRKRILGEL